MINYTKLLNTKRSTNLNKFKIKIKIKNQFKKILLKIKNLSL